MSAADAAAMLGVSRATLYAYVSRGFIRSQPSPEPSRERRYSREDVEGMRRRAEERRDPRKAAAHALDWGGPVLESAITFIDGRSLYYRGHDAIALARTRPVADVASLIWTGSFDAASPSPPPRTARTAAAAQPRGAFVPRAHAALATAAASDPSAYDLRPHSVALTGWRIVRLLAEAAAPGSDAAAPLDEALARVWRVPPRGVDVLRQTLILCADHELNVSAFTARCVASAGSHPYNVVIAALAALEGIRHGGTGARVDAMLQSMRRAKRLDQALAERLRRGESIDGFGHPLYPAGDPRAAALVSLMRDRYARSSELAFVLEFLDASQAVLRDRPNVDFALAAVSRVLGLPPGAPLMLFAIGRTIGWIGHAIEQYESKQLLRPRAAYVGTPPIAPEPAEREK